MRKALHMARPCRLQPEELVAYDDGTLSGGRREIVEAHLAACPHCQERMAAFHEVDRIILANAISVDVPVQRRSELRTRLNREANRRSGMSTYLQLASPLQRPVVALGLVALLLLLTVVPTVTEAGFPLGRFVRFAKVELEQALPRDAQDPIRHVASSVPDSLEPSFQAVAPAELPLGLVRVEQSTPNPDRVELLYRNQAGVAILVTEIPAATGMVTLESTGTDLSTVRDTDVLIVDDPRPEAVAALFWERDGVFFGVLVIEAPPGAHGGLKRADALLVVEAMMEAQDADQQRE